MTRTGVRAPRAVVAGGHSAGHGTVRGLDTALIPARGYHLVGFGGYVAMPAYLAARRRGAPIVVHEANARPGVANWLAARMTTHVFTAGPSVRLAHATAIGVPLRPEITGLDRAALRGAARQRFGLRPGGPVLHITGPQHAVRVPDGGPADPPYVDIPYVAEMRDAYAAADFALCRAGAMTCAELAAVGLPAAYVPPPLRGGEQRHNAEPAVAAGGALLVDDADLNRAWIQTTLIPVVTDPRRTAAMSARASAAAAPDAGVVLARHVLTAVAERRRLAFVSSRRSAARRAAAP